MSHGDASNPPYSDTFAQLDDDWERLGPDQTLDRLIEELSAHGSASELLDALMLKARRDLGMLPVQQGRLSDLPEPLRTQFEERYIEAIRTVGRGLLRKGLIARAWPYFRTIAETEPVAHALADAYEQLRDAAEELSEEQADAEAERIGELIEIAFNEGAHPEIGFAFILDHYGTCSAITAFEQLPQDPMIRTACAVRLVEQVHRHLGENIRADLERRGRDRMEGRTLIEVVTAVPELFTHDNVHIDTSHLASTVRLLPMLDDSETLRRGLELAVYGRSLAPTHRYPGAPPFEDVYESHAIFLRAMLNDDPADIEAALAYFQAQLPEPTVDDGDDGTSMPHDFSASLAAQVIVRILERCGRVEEAIDFAVERLAGIPEPALICSSPAQLAQTYRLAEPLAQAARRGGDRVGYLIARVIAESAVDSTDGADDRHA